MKRALRGFLRVVSGEQEKSWKCSMDEQERKKLIWRCRRGMLELDLILQDFLDAQWSTLTEKQVKIFHRLLKQSDPELFDWFMGHEVPSDQEFNELVIRIRAYHQTKAI